MPAAGVVMIVAVVLIVAAVVVYLLSTIVALRRISTNLDEAIIQDGYMNALTDGFGEATA